MDRGLLLALIALQNDFIVRDQFLISIETWLADRSRGLDQILVEKSYLTKSQRESLVSKLISILEQSNNDWRKCIAGNTVAKNVYEAMSTLAKEDPTALDWIERIGDELGIETSGIGATKTLAGDSDDDDPYGTLDFDDSSFPIATLSNDENEDESK